MKAYKLICIIIFIVSITSIAGHIFDVPILTKWIIDGISITIVTAFCFMITSAMCLTILVHYENSLTKFLILSFSFMILFTILIMSLIMYLEMYLNNSSFTTKYLPAIPTLILFFLVSIKGLVYSFSHSKTGLKIRLITFGSLGITLLGFFQYLSEYSFFKQYYPSYNVGMSFITCVLSFAVSLIFLKIAKNINVDR